VDFKLHQYLIAGQQDNRLLFNVGLDVM